MKYDVICSIKLNFATIVVTESRLGGSNFKRKQLAIMLSSFSVSKSDSQNSQNKEDQVQDKAKKRK